MAAQFRLHSGKQHLHRLTCALLIFFCSTIGRTYLTVAISALLTIRYKLVLDHADLRSEALSLLLPFGCLVDQAGSTQT